jgi:hypothetical protein
MLLVYFPHRQLLQRHLAQDQLFSTRLNYSLIWDWGRQVRQYPGVFTIRRPLDGAAGVWSGSQGGWSGQGAPRVRSISNTRPLVAPRYPPASCHKPTYAAQQTMVDAERAHSLPNQVLPLPGPLSTRWIATSFAWRTHSIRNTRRHAAANTQGGSGPSTAGGLWSYIETGRLSKCQ